MLPTQRIKISPDIDSLKAHTSVFFETLLRQERKNLRVKEKGEAACRTHSLLPVLLNYKSKICQGGKMSKLKGIY